jgi:Xaa-Pro aminopeptidase
LAFVFLASTAGRTDAIEKAPLTEYQARREKLAQQIRGSVLVLKAAEELELVRYFQEKNFFYLTGFDEPGSHLGARLHQAPPAEYLFIPARNPSQEQWTGVKLGPGPDAARITGVATVLPNGDLNKLLNTYREAGTPLLELKDVSSKIASMRQIKSAFEIAMIEKAIAATMKGIRAAAAVIAPGAMEYEIEATLEYEFRRNGAERPAFHRSSARARSPQSMHYNANGRKNGSE